MPDTVLVTGGTGFVASWCIVELLRRGYAVRTTVRTAAKEQAVRAAISTVLDPGDRLSFVTADLTADSGWDTATFGCDYVLHVASPLGGDGSGAKNEDSLIVPAREGTLRVLRAATRAKVKRVVMTSSCAAASPPISREDGVSDESVWTDITDKKLNAYRKSKAVAERAAWDFMAEHQGTTTLTTVLPGAVFGPVLTPENLGSVQVIGRMVSGKMPGIPHMGFTIVDVRDLADLHIRAMTAPEAAGERFIAAGDFLWMTEVAEELRSKLGANATKIPTRTIPDFVLKAMSLFDPAVKAILPSLGRKHRHSAAKAQHLLAWHPRPATATVVDCAESLLANNAL